MLEKVDKWPLLFLLFFPPESYLSLSALGFFPLAQSPWMLGDALVLYGSCTSGPSCVSHCLLITGT